jgi:CBS domain-containing protein
VVTPIRDIMTTRVVTVRSGEPVAAAVERMTRFGFSALPVVTASNRLVGIVSLLDVLRHRQEAADAGVLVDEGAVAVDEIMTADVFSLAATANAGVVADRLRRYGELRVLPIVDGGRLVGVVTRGDLLRRLLLPGAPARRRRGLSGLLGRGRRREADDASDALSLLAAQRRRRPPADPDAPVRDVMTTDVATAGPADQVAAAAVAMLRGRHSALPVVDADGRLLGVVSEADLLADAARRPAPVAVARVMTAPAVSVPADATVAQARELLVERGLRTLPVTGADGRLVGVLGRSDLV